jgi:hypothetical protein
MLNGLMIDELISMVEKAEKQSHARVAKPAQSVVRNTSYPVVSRRIYDYAILDQAVIGVA